MQLEKIDLRFFSNFPQYLTQMVEKFNKSNKPFQATGQYASSAGFYSFK